MKSDYVRIFDTTLRDGEQSPGATMTTDEKVLIAQKLEQLSVDVIEAGFPASSPGEREAVQRVAGTVRHSQVCALCRTREEDIDHAWSAIKSAASPLLHVFIATSDLHLQHKLKLTRRQVLEEIRRGVADCRSVCGQVEFSAEDATRTDVGFLVEAVSCAIENGATIVNIPDTVGYTMPDEYIRIIGAVKKAIGPRPVIISVHCHNDLGMAVANSLAAVSAGARQVECCINGIGERAGNAALEEVVAALRVRPDLFGVTTRVKTREIMKTSRLVSGITGLAVQPNKAVVGVNAFAHEAGIHQHGMLNDHRTYEILRPEDFGVADSKMVLGKHSGRAALSKRLSSLGHDLKPEQVERVFLRFKELADKKQKIFDEDLYALVAAEVFSIPAPYSLESIMVSSGSHSTATASVTVRVNGESRTAGSVGDGPVNAAIEAIKKCTERGELSLEAFHLDSITEGSDAQGRVLLTVLDRGELFRGRATHTDVVIASAKAFIDALNHQAYVQKINEIRDDMKKKGKGSAR